MHLYLGIDLGEHAIAPLFRRPCNMIWTSNKHIITNHVHTFSAAVINSIEHYNERIVK